MAYPSQTKQSNSYILMLGITVFVALKCKILIYAA